MAETTKISKDLVFPKAGHFMFVPYGANGLPDMLKAYTSANGIVVSIARDMTLNTVDLPDGNSPYAAAKFVSTQDGTLTYVLSTYDPELEALVSGASFKSGEATSEMWTIKQTEIPKITPFEITLETKPKSIDNILIKDAFGISFEPAADAATVKENQYFCDTTSGKITFFSADAEKAISIVYTYDGVDVAVVEYQENPKITNFMAIVIGETKDKDETQSQRTNVIVDRCTVSGAVTPPTASNDPTTGWTLTTNVLKPRAGKNPLLLKFEPIVEVVAP